MKNLLLFCTLFLLVFQATAQDERLDFTKSGDVDPQAKAVLEKVKKKYESYQSMDVTFTITIALPEEPEEIQKGTLQQMGEKYRLELASHSIISDGQYVWLYLKNNKEVQINNVDSGADGEVLSPKDLLHVYNSGKFVYALTNEFMENGRAVQQIEFKPIEEYTEYSKIRLTIDKNSQKILRIKAFEKNGARYTLEINELTPNKSFTANTFVWQKSECPDCYVEDLRID